MSEVRSGSYGEHQDLLEVDPNEFAQLFDTILINVTGFFRDREAWDYVAEHVVPRSSRRSRTTIRSGCGPRPAPPGRRPTRSRSCSGRPSARTSSGAGSRSTTDVDDAALSKGRQARYTHKELEAIPADLLGKYFERNALGQTFRADLRRSVIFGRNDLVQDAPISRVDLLGPGTLSCTSRPRSRPRSSAASTSPSPRPASSSSASQRCSSRTTTSSHRMSSSGGSSGRFPSPDCATASRS
jgi:two-component system CheB/CheR fusion protein